MNRSLSIVISLCKSRGHTQHTTWDGCPPTQFHAYRGAQCCPGTATNLECIKWIESISGPACGWVSPTPLTHTLNDWELTPWLVCSWGLYVTWTLFPPTLLHSSSLPTTPQVLTGQDQRMRFGFSTVHDVKQSLRHWGCHPPKMI